MIWSDTKLALVWRVILSCSWIVNHLLRNLVWVIDFSFNLDLRVANSLHLIKWAWFFILVNLAVPFIIVLVIDCVTSAIRGSIFLLINRNWVHARLTILAKSSPVLVLACITALIVWFTACAGIIEQAKWDDMVWIWYVFLSLLLGSFYDLLQISIIIKL